MAGLFDDNPKLGGYDCQKFQQRSAQGHAQDCFCIVHTGDWNREIASQITCL